MKVQLNDMSSGLTLRDLEKIYIIDLGESATLNGTSEKLRLLVIA